LKKQIFGIEVPRAYIGILRVEMHWNKRVPLPTLS
jgi:hypothetical protein